MRSTGHDSGSVTPWEAFARRHGDLPFLACETLYALSCPIIEAVQAELPGFFTAAQERFEKDLARTASFGFFRGRVLGFSAAQEATLGESLQERQARTARAIDALLREEYRRSGVADLAIAASRAAAVQRREAIGSRKQAFTGWLIAQPAFHREVGQLRAAWGPLVAELGRFPVYPRWPAHDLGLDTEVPEAFRAEVLASYRRWGLDQLLTWEWPVPMEPDLVGGLVGWDERLGEAGVVLFVPWYLLKGQKLNVQEIVRHSRQTEVPPQLRGWVQKSGRGQEELGEVRYQRLAWLYRYLVLALRRRYPEACRRRAQRLDWALSRVLGVDDESVRKARQQLQRAAAST
jgi:hypothetical protein